MSMKKIEGFIASAPKTKGNGEIKYCLWVNEAGNKTCNLHVQIIDNDGDGTYSKNLFSVSEYLSYRNSNENPDQLKGLNVEKNIPEVSNNNNDIGFLKAVLRHLLD